MNNQVLSQNHLIKQYKQNGIAQRSMRSRKLAGNMKYQRLLP